jgi:hypothetical protein
MSVCDKCPNGEFAKENGYYHWLSLSNFLYFLLLEGYIEEPTYKTMEDHLMSLKCAVIEMETARPEKKKP